MFGLSPVQILIVLAIALLVFGAKRVPEMARGMGSGMREFKQGITGETAAPPPPPAVATPAAAPDASPESSEILTT